MLLHFHLPINAGAEYVTGIIPQKRITPLKQKGQQKGHKPGKKGLRLTKVMVSPKFAAAVSSDLIISHFNLNLEQKKTFTAWFKNQSVDYSIFGPS